MGVSGGNLLPALWGSYEDAYERLVLQPDNDHLLIHDQWNGRLHRLEDGASGAEDHERTESDKPAQFHEKPSRMPD